MRGVFGPRCLTGVGVLILAVMLPKGASARYTHGPWPDNLPSPQYANIAPLPGAGIALNSAGDPDGLGAMQVNIPVAYTPQMGYISASISEGAYPDIPRTEFENGTGVFALGFFNKPALYASGMQCSSILDESKCLSFQMSLLRESRRQPGLAIGVQDLLEKEARMQSVYFVTTKEFAAKDRRVFATVGYGGGRFLNLPFAGVSTPLSESTNLAVEWDGYQFNAGVGWRPGGRHGWFTFLTAYNGRAGWLFSGAAAFRPGKPKQAKEVHR